MNPIESVKTFYDQVFGNRDGKFSVKDLPNHAVWVVAIVVDLVMLVAEYRVWGVGYKLTGNFMLAIGFVVISSLPFYLGQLAYLYNRANGWQQGISIFLVIMGLFVSAYYGFADYIMQTNGVITIANGVSLPMDVNSLYIMAVVCTVALIVSGLVYALVDDQIANRLKQNRLQGKANTARQEIDIKRALLADFRKLREEEEALQREFPADFDELQKQFVRVANKQKNPTNGNGTN